MRHPRACGANPLAVQQYTARTTLDAKSLEDTFGPEHATPGHPIQSPRHSLPTQDSMHATRHFVQHHGTDPSSTRRILLHAKFTRIQATVLPWHWCSVSETCAGAWESSRSGFQGARYRGLGSLHRSGKSCTGSIPTCLWLRRLRCPGFQHPKVRAASRSSLTVDHCTNSHSGFCYTWTCWTLLCLCCTCPSHFVRFCLW